MTDPGNLLLDPELAQIMPEPFTLSIEPIGVDKSYQHPYHLGTHLLVAKDFAQEIWHRVNNERGCYTVALKQIDSHGIERVAAIYDGSNWSRLVNHEAGDESRMLSQPVRSQQMR